MIPSADLFPNPQDAWWHQVHNVAMSQFRVPELLLTMISKHIDTKHDYLAPSGISLTWMILVMKAWEIDCLQNMFDSCHCCNSPDWSVFPFQIWNAHLCDIQGWGKYQIYEYEYKYEYFWYVWVRVRVRVLDYYMTMSPSTSTGWWVQVWVPVYDQYSI